MCPRRFAGEIAGRFVFDGDFLLFYIKFMMIDPSPARASATPHQQALAQRLRRLARSVRLLAVLAAGVFAALPVLMLLAPEWLMNLGLEPAVGYVAGWLLRGEATAAGRWRLAVASLPLVLVGLALMWQLWTLFGEYQRGAVFSPRALRSLQRFATLMVVLAVLEPVSRALNTVVLSWDRPVGQRVLAVTLTSNDYALLLGALVFVALARVMREAARVAEENEGFV